MNKHLATLLLFFLTACGGQVKGVVFLDGNGNSFPDPEEKTLTNVAVQVTKDALPVAHLRTDAAGFFTTPIDKTGFYCVTVEEPALQQNLMAQFRSGQISRKAIPSIHSNIALGPSIKTMKQTLNPAPVEKNTAEKNEESEEESKKTELNPNQTRAGSTDVLASTTEAGKTCHFLKDRNLTANVGVQLDYAGEMEQIPAPTVKKQNDFEPFQLIIQHPFGCFLKPIIFQDALELLWPSDEEKQDPAVAFIDEQGSRIEFSDRLLTGTVSLYLRPRADIPFGKHTIEINPQILCPDGKGFALPPHQIQLDIEPQIILIQRISPRVLEGGTTDWDILLQNKTTRRVTVKVIAEYPTADATILPIEGLNCVVTGDHLECPSIVLAANSGNNEIRFRVKFDNINEPGAIPVSFKVKGIVDGIDQEFEMKATDARVMIDPVN